MPEDHPDEPSFQALGICDDTASSNHDVPEYDAYWYYAGLSTSSPKLVYRTSTDEFIRPTGRGVLSSRLMKLRHVPDNHQLGENGLWDRIRSEVRGVLQVDA